MLLQAFVKQVDAFVYINTVLNAMYCILGAPSSRLGGAPNHLAPALVATLVGVVYNFSRGHESI